MSFIRFWMGFTVVGLAATVTILYWALKARQFGEPDRAAYLPLGGVPAEPPATRGRDGKVLAGVLGLGIAVLVTATVLSMVW